MDRNRIFAFIRAQRLGVISTVHASGAPEAALVGFGFDAEIGIVFDTSSTSRKAVNLRARPAVAFVVGWEAETTVQIEGVAREPAGDELQRAKAVYFAAWPDGREREAWPDITYFIVRLTWVRYSNFQGAPVVVELHLPHWV
jgi:pyridoxine/pyridoxamine 5'-phosphate oxidase